MEGKDVPKAAPSPQLCEAKTNHIFFAPAAFTLKSHAKFSALAICPVAGFGELRARIVLL